MKTFEALHDVRPHLLRDGITARAVQGERITLAVVDLAPNATLPEHHHDNEQLGFVIKGTIEFRVGSDKRVLKAGDTYVIASHVPHEAKAGPDGATVADVFAPIRADWADLKRGEPSAGNWP
ncbi:MAG TPA: cupin domain-containing protein [Candidatus Dormibacteraeota bacterium]|nr:cupin domain-containing protein [Candidatus Dormibacteraeota bacterium]